MFSLVTMLPHLGAVANWIWGIIGFIIAAVAVAVIIALATVKK